MVAHRRQIYRKGKEIRTLSDGVYEITIFVINSGKTVIEGMQVIDKIPVNYRHGNYTINPEVESTKDQVALRWKIPDLPPSGHWEVVYRIWGSGSFNLENTKCVS